MHKHHSLAFLLHFAAFFIVISMSTLLVYTAVQQDLRQGANDPQIQMAGDFAMRLANDEAAAYVVNGRQVDLAKSLAPFAIAYDLSGNVLASNGQLNATSPVPPSGVFEYANTHIQDRLTWQPQAGVRIAAVVQAYQGSHPGYILVGRSLDEVEKREMSTANLVFVAWVLGNACVLVVLAVKHHLLSRRHE